MTMRRYADVLATVGEYTDRNGRKAKRSLKVGVLMRDPDSGRMSIKLDAVPVRPDWSGWLKVARIGIDDDAEGE